MRVQLNSELTIMDTPGATLSSMNIPEDTVVNMSGRWYCDSDGPTGASIIINNTAQVYAKANATISIKDVKIETFRLSNL